MTTHGFVFAATGSEYIALAQRAAKTVQLHCPGYPVDLFTDVELPDTTFSRTHVLNKSWHRPKMECLYRSRFDKTVYLDADLFVIADISDIFVLLGRFGIAAAHDQYRNHENATRQFKHNLPASFPQYNSGVIGVSRTETTDAFLREWEKRVRDSNSARDQPIFRELLLEADINICTLPAEYNVHRIDKLRTWTSDDTAPRIIHHQALHQHISFDRPELKSVEALLGKPLSRQINQLIAADNYLTPKNTSPFVSAFCDRYPNKRLPAVDRFKGVAAIKRRLRHPFRGTNGERWYRAIKKLLISPTKPD